MEKQDVWVAVSAEYTTDAEADINTGIFYKLKDAVEWARKMQYGYCKAYGWPKSDMVPHDYKQNKEGEFSQFDEIDGDGSFITEDDNANRLIIDIYSQTIY